MYSKIRRDLCSAYTPNTACNRNSTDAFLTYRDSGSVCAGASAQNVDSAASLSVGRGSPHSGHSLPRTQPASSIIASKSTSTGCERGPTATMTQAIHVQTSRAMQKRRRDTKSNTNLNTCISTTGSNTQTQKFTIQDSAARHLYPDTSHRPWGP